MNDWEEFAIVDDMPEDRDMRDKGNRMLEERKDVDYVKDELIGERYIGTVARNSDTYHVERKVVDISFYTALDTPSIMAIQGSITDRSEELLEDETL